MDSANNPAATPRQPLLEVRGVVREFPAGDTPIVVLKDVDLAIEAGEMVASMFLIFWSSSLC